MAKPYVGTFQPYWILPKRWGFTCFQPKVLIHRLPAGNMDSHRSTGLLISRIHRGWWPFLVSSTKQLQGAQNVHTSPRYNRSVAMLISTGSITISKLCLTIPIAESPI
jgi:hypothetical protein